jgi:chemotaxis signal transduction protein/chemotaxis regulatin CheY-phosphate phosphatase CheZ
VQQYIGFHLHDGDYAIPITVVREIINLPGITKIPQSPPYLRGITNLRGTVIPVVNLKQLINLPEGREEEKKVIVIASGSITFGILVDGITGVVSIAAETIESPEAISHGQNDRVEGIAKQDGRLILILNAKKLIPLEDMHLLEDRTLDVREIDSSSTVEVTKTVQTIAGEMKVKEIINAKDFYKSKKGLDPQDPQNEIVEAITAFMTAITEHDYEKADIAIQGIVKGGQGDLFKEVGKITRKLHDTIKGFKESLDPRLKDMANVEIPNAADRLQYVIDRTEEAANKTMGVVEKYILRMDDLASHIRKIEGPAETAEYLRGFKNGLEDDLTEILTTQSFQDLTGQTIKKVIQLVGDIEKELVTLIAHFGVKIEPGAKTPAVAPEKVSQAGVDDLLKEFGF